MTRAAMDALATLDQKAPLNPTQRLFRQIQDLALKPLAARSAEGQMVEWWPRRERIAKLAAEGEREAR